MSLNKEIDEKLLEFSSLVFRDLKNLPENILAALDSVFNYKLTAYSIFEKDTKIYPIRIIGANLDQNMLKNHKTDVYSKDIFYQKIPQQVHKSKRCVYVIKDFIDLEVFKDTPYGKHLRHFNLHNQAVLYTSNSEFPRHAISIFKTVEGEDFSDNEIVLLDKIGQIFISAVPIYKQLMQQQNSIELIQNFCNNISYSFAIITNSKKIEYYNESFINYAQILTKQSDIDMVFKSLTSILENTISAPLDSLIRPITIDLDNCKIIITPNTLVNGDYVKRYLFLTIFERDEDEFEDQKDNSKPKVSVYSLSLLKQYNLTKRELEILQLMMEGYSNQQIADIQYISIFTVKTHNKNIFRKLKVSTRMEAVAKLKELQ